MNKLKLNEDQERAVEQMLEFVRKKSADQLFLLEGSAGTGKTTCVQEVVRDLVATGNSIVLTAPTNKATKVLRSTAARMGLGDQVSAMTIYSLLGLRLSQDSEFVRIEPLGQTALSGLTAVVVDEASMISAELFNQIGQACNAFPHVKFIFMGDAMQLPPVGEDNSMAMQLADKAVLYKVERHDNQILTLATHLRDCIAKRISPSLKTDADENGGVVCVDYKKMRGFLERTYGAEEYGVRPDTVKTIAWRNMTVDSYNQIIREELIYKKEDLPKFMLGERLIATNPVVDFAGVKAPLMSTDEEADCVSLQVGPHPMFPNIGTYQMLLESEFCEYVVPAYVPHETSESAYKRQLKELYDLAKSGKKRWAEYHDFRTTFFAALRPCHSITAHRSQGSTYESVVVDVRDILSNRNESEAMRCLYVACTRASKKLVLRTR